MAHCTFSAYYYDCALTDPENEFYTVDMLSRACYKLGALCLYIQMELVLQPGRAKGWEKYSLVSSNNVHCTTEENYIAMYVSFHEKNVHELQDTNQPSTKVIII